MRMCHTFVAIQSGMLLAMTCTKYKVVRELALFHIAQEQAHESACLPQWIYDRDNYTPRSPYWPQSVCHSVFVMCRLC